LSGRRRRLHEVLLSLDSSRVIAVLFVLAMFSVIGCLGMFLREVYPAVTGGAHRIP
jgi:hypothetical protein